MKTTQSMLIASLSSAFLAAGTATAAIEYDQDVTSNAIFGGGNLNGSYTTDRQNGVEIGLRGKVRHDLVGGGPLNQFNSNGDGTYTFQAGVPSGQSSPVAVWSFEWSINSNFDGTSGYNIGDLTYELGLDTDPTAGTNYTTFDPINDINPGNGMVFWDHSMGNNSTAMGAGVEATDATDYANLIASNNLAQQSWKAHWFFSPFDPTVNGQYEIYLSASDGTGEIARSAITINVVPEPGSIALLGLGGLALIRRRRRA